MEAVNFHLLDAVGRAQTSLSLELPLAVLRRALLWQLCGCAALPKLGQGSGCVPPPLALPGKRLSSSGRAGRPALPHGPRSLPPLRQPLEAAGCSLESAPASLHPCSPDRPAQHTSAQCGAAGEAPGHLPSHTLWIFCFWTITTLTKSKGPGVCVLCGWCQLCLPNCLRKKCRPGNWVAAL